MTGGPFRAAAALVLLAPVCAAYVAGADQATGHPLAMAAGIVRLAALLGGPALLIREVARRRQLGWRGIALLAAAFGVAYTGLIEQSLFSATYDGIPTWDGWRQTTAVPLAGVAPDLVLTFAGGIAIYGVAAPIAVVEALSPEPRAPWLNRWSLALVAVLSVAAAVVAGMRLVHGSPRPDAVQAGVTASIAALLALAAMRRRAPATTIAEPAPSPVAAFAGSLAASVAVALAADGWWSTLVGAGILAVAAWWIADAARARDWDTRHAAAIAGGALAGRALLAFTYVPLIGDVGSGAKLLHNVTMLGLVAGLTIAAVTRGTAARAPGRARLRTAAARSTDRLAWRVASGPGSTPASRARS